MQPPDGPPVWTALTRPFPGAPPPMSWTTSRIVVPSGTSTSPVFRIFPTTEKIFVPVFPGRPTFAKAAAPARMMTGMFARVSTLLMQVGRPSIPFWIGYGGRCLGSPA